MSAIYRFHEFKTTIPTRDIQKTLYMSVVNTESIFGKAQVQLDAPYSFDFEKRVCAVDGTTEAGQALAKNFISWLTRAFGADSFKVERLRKRKQFADNERREEMNQSNIEKTGGHHGQRK